MLFVVVSLFVIFPVLTKAESITNNNGIVISEEEYNNFLKIRTHEYIMTMTQEKYDKLKSLDYSNVRSTEKYVASTYNRSLNLTTEREITKEEYDNYDSEISPYLNDAGDSYETQVKKITLAVVGGTTWNYVVTTATWKSIPSVRSYDVIGVRGERFEFRDGSQTGEQVYYLNGTYNYIDYAWNGTNIQRHDNGFGISMNIVNSDIESLQLSVDCDVKATGSAPALFSSYQHAVQEVSLANSQNYTLSGAGLGGVFVFPYSISQKYDGMGGTYIQY